MKKVSVDIGIAAYNAERNIGTLLESIVKQNEDTVLLKRIIVHSDSSTDKTDILVKSIKDDRISLIRSARQQGFARSIQKILQAGKADIFVLLNDDIRIRDIRLLSKICEPFLNDSNIGLVAGRPLPYYTNSFLNKAIMSGFRAYDKARLAHRQGHNIHTMDGKIFAVSGKFKKLLTFTNDLGKMGNVDSYFYLQCLCNNLKYHYAKNAVVQYRNPSTLQDYLTWYIRNNTNKYKQIEQFGDIAKKEFTIPAFPFIYHKIRESTKNPLGSLFLFLTRLYIEYKAKQYKEVFDGTWTVVSTTKRFRKNNVKNQ